MTNHIFSEKKLKMHWNRRPKLSHFTKYISIKSSFFLGSFMNGDCFSSYKPLPPLSCISLDYTSMKNQCLFYEDKYLLEKDEILKMCYIFGWSEKLLA